MSRHFKEQVHAGRVSKYTTLEERRGDSPSRRCGEFLEGQRENVSARCFVAQWQQQHAEESGLLQERAQMQSGGEREGGRGTEIFSLGVLG